MSVIIKYLFYFFAFLAIIIFVLSSFLNINHWVIGIISLAIPVLLFLNILFLIYWSITKKYIFFVVTILIFVLGFKDLRKTFVINTADKRKGTVKILSYNVGTFNLKRYNRIHDSVTPGLMMKWFKKNTTADIVCLQEFYTNSFSEIENSVEAITNVRKLYYFYTNPIFWHDMKGFFGVITFSRFPIINSGPLIFGDSSLNRGVYLDLKVQEDTLRLINIHLHSMTIRRDTSDVFLPTRLYRNTLDIVGRLKDGITRRNAEIDVITSFIKKSPYPVILCGDFNDAPYSYTYQKVSEMLINSFEEAGFGFGFTYSGFPWIIRIDNQFHDKRLKAVSFKIFKDNTYSDHYPIQAEYILNK